VNDTVQVSVRVLDRELVVAVPAGERAELMACADYLNACAAQLRRQARIAGSDRLVMLAALNVAQELLRLRERERVLQEAVGRLDALGEKLEAALDGIQDG
jgi:cell division protein ZapA